MTSEFSDCTAAASSAAESGEFLGGIEIPCRIFHEVILTPTH
jgi:hypothetical protein